MAAVLIDFFWTFGDGRTSREENPSHLYRMPGIYQWTWSATDEFGNTITESGTVYVYDWDEIGGLNVARTNQCLRYSMKPSQGFGWAEFGGDDFPFPEARVGTLKVVDDVFDEHLYAINARTRRIFELGVRDIFQDSLTDYAGSEISCGIDFRWAEGSAKHYWLKSLEHHLHFQPHDRHSVGADGYTDSGFRPALEVDYSLRKDGDLTDTVKTEDIPLEGDITFKHDEQAHYWQPIARMSTSEWRLISVRDYYVRMDKQASPNDEMSEDVYQRAISNVSVHLGRDSNRYYQSVAGNTVLPRNLATGTDFTGASSVLFAGGPDGRDGSAYTSVVNPSLPGEDNVMLTAETIALDGDFTIGFWLNGIAATTGIITAVPFQIKFDFDEWELHFDDTSGNHYQADVAWRGSGWVHFVVQRVGDIIRFYENKSMLLSQDLASTPTYSSQIAIFHLTGRIADVRVSPVAWNSRTITFYYNDVIDKGGEATLPLF